MRDADIRANIKIEYRAVDELVANGRNPRKHSSKQIEQLVESIKAFGWTAPIIVDGENGVLAGHGRLAAAKKLKMAEVPVVEIGHLSEAQKRAYLIADNQIALDAGWDYDILREELLELQTMDFDVNLLGFANIEALTAPPKGEKQERAGGAGATSLQYNIIFESVDEQRHWFAFIRSLKARYPDAETLGERLLRFLTDGGYVGAR